jgi:hypothetical protein
LRTTDGLGRIEIIAYKNINGITAKVFTMKKLHIYTKIIKNGISIRFRGRHYPIIYPSHIWSKTPKETQIALKDNLALATTMHLPIVFNANIIVYHSGHPLLEPYFVQNFLKDIPSCTEVDETSTEDIVRKFFNTQYQFLDSDIVYPSPQPLNSPFGAIVGMSFGKDSLLTYAIAKEIGLEPEIVYIIEQSMTYEQKHKTELAKCFKKEFGTPLKNA